MLEKNERRKLRITLLLMPFLCISSFNSFFTAMDKGATGRMILYSIPMVLFPIFIIIILIKLYKK